MPRQSNIVCRLYATLLDAYVDYLDTPLIYDRYWGYSENPPHTLEEFWIKQQASLIDRINRVSFVNEAASKGTAFNDVIDAMVARKNRSETTIYTVFHGGEATAVRARRDGFTFQFPYAVCREFADYYRGAIPQLRVSAVLPTCYGNVEVYGVIDELMPLSVHDIKYTGNYCASKFKHHSQHLVYPYCLMQSGSDVRTFEYNVAEESKSGTWQTYTETYVFDPERDIPVLRERCEGLMDFILNNRRFITDRKIWGGENPEGYIGEPVDINKLMSQ